MLTVCAFHWQKPGYRTAFSVSHVNIHYAMFARHYHAPFRYVVITDDRDAGYSSGIETFPLWADYADAPSPHGPSAPACYRRLKLFDPETAKQIGDRLAWVDLDMVLVGDATPVFDRPEPLVLLKTGNDHAPYNGSMVLMDAGARPDLWEQFTPEIGKITKAEHCMGSDQGWISWKLRGEAIAHWKLGDGGVYSRRHLQFKEHRKQPPDDARLIIFPGKPDPWDFTARRKWPWLKYHYAEKLLEQNLPTPEDLALSEEDCERHLRHLESIRPFRYKIPR